VRLVDGGKALTARDGEAEGEQLIRVSPSFPSSSGFRLRLDMIGFGEGDSVSSRRVSITAQNIWSAEL
jgi:hypothetical protein